MRDYLFDARTGYYLVDKPVGWFWGSAELDPALHTIIRTDSPAFEDTRALLLRRSKLVESRNHSGQDNIWTGGILAPCDSREFILPPVYVNLRNGAEYATENDMWDSVSDGDKLVLFKWGEDGNRPAYAIKITSVANKQADYKQVASIEEAEQWT